MDEADKQKTAFATHKGLFQFKVLPFGISNNPATSERLMEAILSRLQWERCLVYLDDIITFGSTFEETLEKLTSVFDRLKSANLKLKPKKRVLFQELVTVLGHIVSHDGIRVQWSSLQNQQDNDPSISQVKGFLLKCTERPKVNDPNPTVNCLLRQWDRLTIVNNILYRKWEKDRKEVVLQLVAPKSLRREIMCILHNNRTSGHLGREKTMQSIKSRFYWPGMSDDKSLVSIMQTVC